MTRKKSFPKNVTLNDINKAALEMRANAITYYERIAKQVDADHVTRHIWKNSSEPAAARGWPSGQTSEQVSFWPTQSPPVVSLKPCPGFSLQQTGTKLTQVVFIGAFGLNEQRLAKVVEQIQNWHASETDSVPLFLTDCPQPKAFRQTGYNFEYFPSASYCGIEQKDQFAERFQFLWQKWNASYFIDLSAPSFLRTRLENYEKYLMSDTGQGQVYNPHRSVNTSSPSVVTDHAALRAEYLSKEQCRQPDTFVLCRILGSDLPPRHKPGQQLENLRFILEYEPDFENCEKRWVVNRIIDPEQEQAIINLLVENEQAFIHLPFDLREYSKADWDLNGFPDPDFLLNGQFFNMTRYDQLRAMTHIRRNKTRYVVNNNGARNTALRDGRERAKWVLPWDGNCFLTDKAWKEMVNGVLEKPHLKYFCVPMARMANNDDLRATDGERPQAQEEPQIVFRAEVLEEFDETIPYGRRPKVNLLWRLGVPGLWDEWGDDVWDLPRPKLSEDAGAFGTTGWVARLNSGREDLEEESDESRLARAIARNEGLVKLLDDLDKKALSLSLKPNALTAYDPHTIQSLGRAPSDTNIGGIYSRLIQEAELALQRGPYSVVEKSTTAPSGDKHDYYSPAPFWWPSSTTSNGMPGEWREGQRRPDTLLFSSESDCYDRTRIQRMFGDTTVLALAGSSSGDMIFHRHAARLVRCWFLDENTRMNPHLQFADCRPDQELKGGTESGLADMRDIYYFLDAVRLLKQSGALAKEECIQFHNWLEEYLEWLIDSPQGEKASKSNSQTGTSYDLQVAAISTFLGDVDTLKSTLLRSRMRLPVQFGSDGKQKQELRQSETAHYCFLNLQNWINLANLADTCDDRLWVYACEKGRNIELSINWLLSNFKNGSWPYGQNERFDRDRVLPLICSGLAQFGRADGVTKAMQCLRKPIFSPQDGIAPFWMLSAGLRDAGLKADAKTTTLLQKRVHSVQNASKEGSKRCLTVTELEDRLWGGYAEKATSALKQIIALPSLSEGDVEKAAWGLARWQCHNGDHEQALKTLRAIDPSRRMTQKNYILLEADLLCSTGMIEASRMLVANSLDQRSEDPSLLLAMANTYATSAEGNSLENDATRLSWINKVYIGNGLQEIEKITPTEPLSFFNIQGATNGPPAPENTSEPKISVIIPVYNGAGTISVALRSLQNQTWKNLQIIVSDDASTDKTCDIVREAAKSDSRIQLVTSSRNAGTYVARNAGLAQATGDFVTVHDADDWSHPQKIELQARRLIKKEGQSAVLSTWGRVDPDLIALSNWRPVATLFSNNHSSLLIPGKVFDEIGSWDNVRIGADMEFLWRFRKKYGNDAVSNVNSSIPLSLSLVRPEALTKAEATHVKTIYYGVRQDYRRAYLRWQDSLSDDEFILDSTERGRRAFPAPSLMHPDRETSPEIDCVFVSDFSESAYRIKENIELIYRAISEEKRVGIFHWPDYESQIERELHTVINELLDTFQIEQVCAFQQAKARTVVFCDPLLARHVIDGLPVFDVSEVLVLCPDAGSQQVAFDNRRRRMPTLAELEALWGCKCKWEVVEPVAQEVCFNDMN